MRDLRISELIHSTDLQQQNLVPIVDGSSTKRLELSALWEACLNGTLNAGNTAIFTQNVFVSGDLTTLQGDFIHLLKIPSGTTFDRVSALGAIRYNTTTEVFEGFNGTSWGQIGGNILQDGDNDTRIEVDSIPFSDSDQIKFTTNGSLRTIILSSGEVGIGTPNPIKPLTVVGDISATGRVYGSNFYPQRRFEYNRTFPPFITNPISYSGTAPFGYAESDGIWTITRIVYTPSGTAVASIEVRTDVAWADRVFVFIP
jgi:hypothetical protein